MKTLCRNTLRVVTVISAFLFFALSAKAQLTNVVVDSGPYTPGSSIAATFTIGTNSCIPVNNTFELYLSDASGTFVSTTPIGTYNGFYSTYVNGFIPTGTPAGTGYKLRVKSTGINQFSDESIAFEVKSGDAVIAGANSTILNNKLNQEAFGTCITKDNNNFTFSNNSSTGAVTTANIKNELTNANTVLTLSSPQPFVAQFANYTVFVKAILNGIVGTKAYLLINNQAITAFATKTNNPVCLPLASFQFNVDLTKSGILENFPGDRYEINWGDGTSSVYNFCDIQKEGGVSHNYSQSSCGRTSNTNSGPIYNSFDVTIRVANDFCGNLGSPLLAYAKVAVKPENRFTFDSPACTNSDVTFINRSILGESPNANSATCSPNEVTYDWSVDGVIIETGKPLSYNFVYKFLTNKRYVIRLTSKSDGACDADPVEQQICIQNPPKPIFTLPNTTVCAPQTLAPVNSSEIDNTCSAVTTYLWTVTPSVGFANGTSAASKDPVFNFTAAGTYSVTLSVTTGSCGPVVSVPQTVIVQGANAGQDQLSICTGNVATLAANNNFPGIWSQVGGPTVNINIPTQYNTTVTGITPGNSYLFRWTITGGTCPDSYDEVTVTYPTAITNNISPSTLTICSGQTVTLSGSLPTGGTGIYTYQWQSSTDNSNWTNVTSGGTAQNLNIAITALTYFRRMVTSGSCISNSNAIQINVLPAITNNIISANQSLCIGASFNPLEGTLPTGGDGTNFTYQWQSSINGTTWVDITGATFINYAPPQPAATIYYRRLVASGVCSGASQNSSSAVTITVNQPAKAEINFINDKGCAPFALTAANITAGLYPGRNSTFTWFADNVQIGTGATFPGYNLATDNSSVVIKLVVTSGANCGSDEISHTFSTYQSVTPNFTQNVTDGCGPLSVTVVNTSSSLTAATFKWDFGNGITSNLATPPTVIYQPDPAGQDITYTIKLETTTPCGTLTKTSTVLVKALPISVFSPDKTTGCSPFTATFSNTSPGNYTSFTYDFGDGTTLTTNDKNSVTHTYTTIAVKDYIVKMTARNNCGVNESQYTVRVSPNNIVPELVVNATELRGCAPLTVTFFNNTKGASTFYYDFGDGSSALTSTAPEMIAHTFTKPGSYLVTLYASNSCSNAYTTETIVVLDQPSVAFTSDKTIGCSGTVISFKNNSKNAITYLWDFGDGTTSTAFEPQHTFTGTATNYTVSLKATNLQGCGNTSTIPNYINLVAPPQSIFTVLPGNELSIPNFTFSFRDASLNAAGSWEWSFGDGSTSTLQNPTHTYANVGDYTVTLKVLNKEGCPGTSSQVVRIIGVPGFLYIPNSFMPASQKNELQTFKAKGRGIDNWTMTIFNKWGQVLWETTKLSDGSPMEGWDGKYNGQEQPQGVYFWKIDLKFINGGEWKGMTYDSSAPKKTGNIYLIR